MNENRRLDPGWWVAIVVAVIAASGAVSAALINGWFQHPKAASVQDSSTKMHPLSGFVTDANGRPLAHAKVFIFQDASAPEPILTDTDGGFAVQVRDSSEAVLVHVVLDGYNSFDENEPVKRTTPLQIKLSQIRAEPKITSALFPPNRATTPPEQKKPTPSNDEVTQASTPAQVPNIGLQRNDAPIGIQNNAPNMGQQNVFGAPRPAPSVDFVQTPVTVDTKGTNPSVCRRFPCVSLAISVGDTFSEPIFEIHGNEPFEVIAADTARISGITAIVERLNPELSATPDHRAWRVETATGAMGRSTQLLLILKTGDTNLQVTVKGATR